MATGSQGDGISARAAAEAAAVCACLNVRRTARAVTRLFDAVLEPSGLRSTQFVVLVGIRAAGEPTLQALATALGMDRSALTRRLQPLCRSGWVKVTASRAGGASRARLTARGLRKLERTVPLWEDAQGRFVRRLGPKRWDTLLGGLGAAEQAASES